MEDSVILNKSSVERGMFRSVAYRTIVVEESRKNIKTTECIKLPEPDIRKKYFNYSKLDKDGIIRQGIFIEEKDVIVGKVTTKVNKTETEDLDVSITVKSNEGGFVDKVIVTSTVDGYKMVKIKIRTTRVPEIGDKLACFVSRTTEVLTKRGWIYMEDVKLEDSVATLRDDQYIEYQNPTALHNYDVEKINLYELKSQQVELTTTMNHKMYIKKRDKERFELDEARNIVGKRVRYKKDGENINPDIDKYDEFKMDDWLKFLGYWIVDGYILKTRKNKYTFLTCNRETKIVKYGKILIKLGCNFIYENGQYKTQNLNIYKLLFDLKIGNKNIFHPEFTWSLSQRQSRIFLDALMVGNCQNKKNIKFYTSLSTRADDMMRLALHCGWSATKKFENYSFCVALSKHKLTPRINNKSEKSERIFEYSGSVHCIEVPNHVFYVRQNGKGVWTGNSTHGQKGTASILMPVEDMPFSCSSGIVPDVILNPCAIPSRMTINFILEGILGKSALVEGNTCADATPFTSNSVDVASFLAKKLKEHGFKSDGTEVLYSGFTGRPLVAQIWMGSVYYQRLKHLVAEKMHSRSFGPIQQLSRQPQCGRSRDGGLMLALVEKSTMVIIVV